MNAGPDHLIVTMTSGVQLLVRQDRTHPNFTMILGEWPSGEQLAFVSGFGNPSYISDGRSGPPALWCSAVRFTLPWLELLKVADFLQLDIPLPLPLGEQVPA